VVCIIATFGGRRSTAPDRPRFASNALLFRPQLRQFGAPLKSSSHRGRPPEDGDSVRSSCKLPGFSGFSEDRGCSADGPNEVLAKDRFWNEPSATHSLTSKASTNCRVCASATLDELRARLARPLTEQGSDAVTVIDELVRDAAGGILGSAGGRFFGWVIGGSVPAALAADWLVSAWDQNAAVHACGPAVAVMEEIAGRWLKDLLRLPTHASFAFTTGSQLAHVTALAAARHELLARCDWDVERRGLAGAPPIRILSSNERHGSIERAVRLLGLGTENTIDFPVSRRS
jgi:hypothetical protein